MNNNKIAIGAKVSIAFINTKDAPTYYDWMKKYASIAHGIGLDDEYIENLKLEDEYDYIKKLVDNNNYSFSIYENATNNIIGNYGIYSIDKETKSAEIGGFIIDDYQNKGYGTEVIKLIVDYAFKILGIKIVTSTVYEFNKASAKTFEKNGFTLESIKEKTYFDKTQNSYFDELLYSITREKFYNQNVKEK